MFWNSFYIYKQGYLCNKHESCAISKYKIIKSNFIQAHIKLIVKVLILYFDFFIILIY